MMNIPFCERLENFNRVEAQKNWKGIVGNTIMHDVWKINILIEVYFVIIIKGKIIYIRWRP